MGAKLVAVLGFIAGFILDTARELFERRKRNREAEARIAEEEIIAAGNERRLRRNTKEGE